MTKLRLTEWKQIAQSSYYLAELRLKARVSHSRRLHYTTLTLSLLPFLFFSILPAQLQPLYSKAHHFCFYTNISDLTNRGHNLSQATLTFPSSSQMASPSSPGLELF